MGVHSHFWPRPTSLCIALTPSWGDPSKKALQRHIDLAERLIGSDDSRVSESFGVRMYWWDEDRTKFFPKFGGYPEDTHLIVIDASPKGGLRPSSKANEPGLVIHSYTESDGNASRVYCYLLTKLSNESHTSIDVRRALLMAGRGLEFSRYYEDPELVDLLLGIWTDITYSEQT